MIQLSKRLAAVGALVTQGNTLADVGCDHGYLPIYLVQCQRIPRAIAMDVRQGPLSRARGHVEAYGLLDYIELRMGDGLEALEPGEVQTVVAAGMGGPLMEKILKKGGRQLASVRELILQPQSQVGHFRKFLRELPFTVADEDMVKEDGKYYPVVRLAPGKMERDWTEAEYLYGKCLLKKRHPVLWEYLCREEKKLEKLESRLGMERSARAAKRLEELRQEKRTLQEAKGYYGSDM